ncbi:MAG: DinB family protein [Bryobacteraceae bacterium]
MKPDPLRQQLVNTLRGRGAHVEFDSVVADFPPELRGVKPAGLPYSAWQLLAHMRMAQHDILDFCVNPDYAEMKWPDDYWPRDEAPPNEKAWEKCVRDFRKDLSAMEALVTDHKRDLLAPIPHGEGQTLLREALLVADHNAYHLGQLVLLRRLLNVWPA